MSRLSAVSANQQIRCTSGLWHVFCSLLSIATGIGHIRLCEAVTPWTRRSCPVDVIQCRYYKIIRSKPMETKTRETAGLIGSDKVEGTNVYDAHGEKIGSIERVMI